MMSKTPPKNAGKPMGNQGMKQGISNREIFPFILFVLVKRSGNFARFF
jgi:hypothetical protein